MADDDPPLVRGGWLASQGRMLEAAEVFTRFAADHADHPDPVVRLQAATAFYDGSVALRLAGRPEWAAERFDQLVRRLDTDPMPAIHLLVAKSLVNRGLCLQQLGDAAGAMAVYDDVVARYGDARDADLRLRVAMAMGNRAIVLNEVGRSYEELAVYDELLARFTGDPYPAMRVELAKSCSNRVVTLRELGRVDAELAAYDQMILLFAHDPQPEVRATGVSALVSNWARSASGWAKIANLRVSRGKALANRGRRTEALEIYRTVVADYGQDPQPQVRLAVAKAVYNSGITLRDSGNVEQAAAMFDLVISYRTGDPDPEMADLVRHARENRARLR